MTTTLTKRISEVFAVECVINAEYDDNDALLSKHADVTVTRIERFGVLETRALVENSPSTNRREIMKDVRLDDDDKLHLSWTLDVLAD